jgi:hypothetical protein
MKIYRITIVVWALFLIAAGLLSCGGGSMLSTVVVTPDNIIIATGSQSEQKFTATETLSNNSMSLDMSSLVSWTTSPALPAVFSLSPTGLLSWTTATAIISKTTITARDSTNKIDDDTTFEIKNPESTLIVTSQPTLTAPPTTHYMAAGSSHQFSALATFASSTVTQDLTATDQQTPHSGDTAWGKTTWQSDNNNIANVPSGLVTALTYTTATVSIQADYNYSTSQKASGTKVITIIATPLKSLVIDQTNPSISRSLSTTLPLTATGTCAGTCISGSTQSYTSAVVWTSSDPAVAAFISTAGIVTAITTTTGSTIIKATDPITGIASAEVTLTVGP